MVQKYTSLYKDDPIAAELEAGIQGTDVYQGSPYALANVPEFEGIRYATPDYNRYQDLYNLYLGGGFDAAQDDFPIQAGDITGGQMVEAGAGDASPIGTIPLDQTGVTGVNTPFEQNLLDQGVGVQIAPGQPVVAPGEMPVTQAEMDAFNQIPVNTDYSPPTSNPFLVSGAAGGARLPEDLGEVTADDYGTPTVFDDTATLADAGAGIDNVYGTDYQGEPYIEDDLMDYDEHYDMEVMGPYEQAAEDAWKNKEIRNTTAGEMIFDTETGQMEKNIADFNIKDKELTNLEKDFPGWTNAEIIQGYRDEDATMPPMLDPTGQMGAANYQAPQTIFPDQVAFDQGFIDAKDYSATGTLADPAEKMDFVTEQDTAESLYQKAKNYLGENVADSIDWASVIAKGLFNSYIGKPVTLLFDALGGAGEGGPTFQTQKAIELGLAKEGETQDIYGINTQSAFGDYDEYNVDRVEELETALEKARGKYDTEQEYLDMTTYLRKELKDRKKYVDRSGAGGDIQPDATDIDIAADSFLGDGAVAEDAQDLNLMDVKDDMAGVETGDASVAEEIAAADRAAKEAAQRAEDEARARAREEARVASIRAQSAGSQGDGQSGSGAVTTGAGRNPWGRAKGGLIRKQYGSGGIVSLKNAKK